MKAELRNRSLETKEIVDDLKKISNQSSSHYQNALVRLAINTLSDERNLLFGRIDFLFKDDKVPEEICRDYENFSILQYCIPIDKVPDFILDLGSGKKISNHLIKNLHNDFNGNWSIRESTSNKSYGHVKCQYPFTHYMVRLWSTQSHDSNFPVVGKNLGPYPNISKAIIDLLDLNQSRYDGWLNEADLVIVVPDYRARIKKMKIKKKKIQLQIESKFLDENNLCAQFYIDGRKESLFPILKGIIEVDSPEDPNEILALVLEKQTNELLDYIEYTVRWSDSEESIEKEIPEDIVLEWINRGENDNVEFKEVLIHADDVIKSVVAFANTKGGVILVGVKDDCSIIGYKESIGETKNRFERMVAEKCDPPIEFEIEQVDLGQKITVIKIPPGKSKIYAVTNGAIYVRRGSSDRFIKPSELMDLFSNNQRNAESGIIS